MTLEIVAPIVVALSPLSSSIASFLGGSLDVQTT